MARPRFEVTEQNRKTVRALAGFGLTHEQVARMIGLRSPKTLRKYFRTELGMGSLEANAQVARTLFRMATSGENPAATMFWLKTRAKWRERSADDVQPVTPPTLIISQESGE
jgi:hypothetical protein